MRTKLLFLIAATFAGPGIALGQSVYFDFENAHQYSPLPVDVTSGGITAHLTATGQGYSIQYCGVMGFIPVGFSGLCIYPSSINLSDLIIDYSAPLKDFSIMYAPQELACDSSARMRVTAYMNGTYVGTNTTTAQNPGTWPTGILTFSTTGAFNRVVVHYDAPPPTGGDYGVIFMADNMIVTPAATIDTLVPTNQIVNLGKVVGGNVASLAADDNNPETICKFLVPNNNSPFIRLTCDFTTTKPSPTAIDFAVKSQMIQSGAFRIRAFLHNYATATDVKILPDTLINLSYATYTASATGVLTDFVDPSNTMQTTIELQQVGLASTSIPCTNFEFVNLKVSG